MKLVTLVESALMQQMIAGGFANLKVRDMSKKTGLVPQQIISVFKSWDKKGAGRFIRGARGAPSRFETAPLLFIMKTASVIQASPELKQVHDLSNIVGALKMVANNK